MPRDGKAFARTVVPLVAVLVSVLALRGYLPAEQTGAPPPREPQRQDSSPVPVLVLFAVALAIMAFTALAAPRRRARAPSAGELPRGPGASGGRPRKRFLLYATAALLVWLTLILALPRWEVPVPGPEATSSETTSGDPGTERPPDPTGSDPLFGYVLAATIVMVVLSLIAGVRNRTPRTTTDPGPTDDPGAVPARTGGADLARATELALAEVGDRSRDPRAAIIACYVAMETELDKSPSTSPQASDTPSEVLGRAVARRVLRPGSAAELVDLFEEARFSPHVMTERHRAEALHALRAVQQELQDAL
ncbi:DUF4129 domain-containing protein [Mycobacterium sp. pV006]|uniref:DUF4129 domain-containing protein n=1 Tax=Mycobacterium sp. pV006 TaxID=3238983 RepID=UPI00351B5F5E